MFNCKIYHPQGECNQEGTLDNILHNKNYKYFPKIEIKRIKKQSL